MNALAIGLFFALQKIVSFERSEQNTDRQGFSGMLRERKHIFIEKNGELSFVKYK